MMMYTEKNHRKKMVKLIHAKKFWLHGLRVNEVNSTPRGRMNIRDYWDVLLVLDVTGCLNPYIMQVGYVPEIGEL